jgi:hypothetical protein
MRVIRPVDARRTLVNVLVCAAAWVASVGRARAQTPTDAGTRTPTDAGAQKTPTDRGDDTPLDDQPRWPTSADDEADRLGRFLQLERDVETRQAWIMGVGGLLAGAPQIALGAYLGGESDLAARAVAPGLIVAGSLNCLLGLRPLLVPTTSSTLLDLYASERRAGKPARDVVRDIESRWRTLVELQRRRRVTEGILELVIGVPSFATGLTFALAKPGLARMSSETQYGWARALVGLDFLIYQGIASLVAPPADTAFDMYQILRHGSAATPPRVGIVPIPGGVAMGIAGSF